MLTPERIKEKVFQTTGRGSYRSDDVDMFMNEISASYEQMFKENGDLVRKISILAKKVEEYRADEESLKMALLNAQKLADRIVAEAKETAANEIASVKGETDKLREDAAAEAEALTSNAKAEAEKILDEANKEAKDILGNINRKVTHESLVYEMIQKEASEFKSKLIAMYREHITLINDLPEIVEEQLEEEAQAEETVVEETQEVVEAVEEEQEEIVEEVAEGYTVVEDEEPVVVIDEVEEFVPVEEVAEEVEETAVEEYNEPISDEIFKNFEEPEEEPVFAEKKSFKIDLSQIDFADDEDYNPAPAKSLFDNVGVIEEDSDDADDETQASPFKSFFKKK